jgi:hypothetical protein
MRAVISTCLAFYLSYCLYFSVFMFEKQEPERLHLPPNRKAGLEGVFGYFLIKNAALAAFFDCTEVKTVFQFPRALAALSRPPL